jgi:hypothetical protein
MSNAGRPTNYSDEILEKTKEYINGGWQNTGDAIPTIEGLAVYLGVSRRVIYKWRDEEDKQEFMHILDEVQALQLRTLLNNGLINNFNSSITKLMMVKHGYTDRPIEEQKELPPINIYLTNETDEASE